MTSEATLSHLGESDVRIAGLSLWIRRREFPEATDRWDGNWLQTFARCAYPGSKVTAEGPFLQTEEIQSFGDQCASLHTNLVGTASLETIEPYLRVRLTGNPRGQIGVVISLTPDHLNQQHEFQDAIDQSHLPAIVASCRKVLERFPILGIEAPDSSGSTGSAANSGL